MTDLSKRDTEIAAVTLIVSKATQDLKEFLKEHIPSGPDLQSPEAQEKITKLRAESTRAELNVARIKRGYRLTALEEASILGELPKLHSEFLGAVPLSSNL